MTWLFYVSYAALWALVVFQSLVVVGLVKARAVARAAGSASAGGLIGDEPFIGQPVPEFDATTVLGERITSADLRGAPSAILFVSPDCTSCAVTLRDLAGLRAKMDGNVVVVCRSSASRCESLAHHYDLVVPVIVDSDKQLSDRFGISATPTAVMVDAEGKFESFGRPMSPEDLEEQVLRHADSKATPELAVERVGGA